MSPAPAERERAEEREEERKRGRESGWRQREASRFSHVRPAAWWSRLYFGGWAQSRRGKRRVRREKKGRPYRAAPYRHVTSAPMAPRQQRGRAVRLPKEAKRQRVRIFPFPTKLASGVHRNIPSIRAAPSPTRTALSTFLTSPSPGHHHAAAAASLNF